MADVKDLTCRVHGVERNADGTAKDRAQRAEDMAADEHSNGNAVDVDQLAAEEGGTAAPGTVRRACGLPGTRTAVGLAGV